MADSNGKSNGAAPGTMNIGGRAYPDPFVTYATLWIKQAIQRGITNGGSAIRLPSTVAGVRAKVRAAQARHPDASVEFLSDLLDLDPKDVSASLDAAEVVTSLDRRIVSDNHEHTMLDSMVDEHAIDPYDAVEDDISDELREALAGLDKQHRQIIEMHFGLKGKHPKSTLEIAAELSISTTTVKSRRSNALGLLATALERHR